MIATLWSRISARVALGIAGLGFGAASFILAGYTLIQLLSNPDYLVALYWAIMHTRMHHVSDADRYIFAQLIGALIGVFGTAMLALILTYFGVPLKKVPADSGGAKP